MDLFPFRDLQTISRAEARFEFRTVLAEKSSANAAVLYMLSMYSLSSTYKYWANTLKLSSQI